MKAAITIYLGLGILMCACTSLEKMIDKGNFDGAISKSARKMAGKKKLKQKHVVVVEEAFAKATARDLGRVRRLEGSQKSGDWESIIHTYQRIDRRQERMQALLPVVSKEGYKAHFSFVKLAPLEAYAKTQFLTLVYDEAVAILSEARAGSPFKAQQAYRHFARLWEYTNDYQDARHLQAEALHMGTRHILVNVRNETGMYLSEQLESNFVGQHFRDTKWIKYHFNSFREVDYNRKITIHLSGFEVSPEKWVERITVDKKEIEDGFEYQLDKNGNVEKDTSGNDIRVPVYKRIKAVITEIHQIKAAVLIGTIEFFDPRNGFEDSAPLETEVVFEHYSASFSGNRRALSKKSKKHLDNVPLPYPTDEALFEKAIHHLAPMLRQQIKKLHFSDQIAMR